MAIGAPLAEEAAKGALPGADDATVVAAMSSIPDRLPGLCRLHSGGFRLAGEHLLHRQRRDADLSLVIAGMRLVLGPFAHPVHHHQDRHRGISPCSNRNTAAKVGCVLLRLRRCGGHARLWNGSACWARRRTSGSTSCG